MGLLTDVRDALVPAGPTSLNLPRMADGPQTANGRQALVPASTTISQILDYVSGTGDAWPLDFYEFTNTMNRDVAVNYAALNRCVTLVSGAVGQLVTSGTLKAVDRQGRRVTSRRVEHIVDMFGSSVDGGEQAALSFVEDVVADYCLDGNGLVVPEFTRAGDLTRLRRMSSWDSDLFYGADGAKVYKLTPADDDGGEVFYKAMRDVVHVRWPRLLRYGRTRSTRDGFALAPVTALRPALDIGLRGDSYIRQWFTDGARSKLHINYESPSDRPNRMTAETRKELVEYVTRATSSRAPLVTFDGESSYIRDTPSDDQAKDLRSFQVEEVSRVYGVPPPLLNVNMTSWGSGIEQLARLFWRFGLRQHTERFLAPFSLRLLPMGVRFEVDATEMLRGDTKETAELVRVLAGDAQREPIASREEMRRLAGLPRDVDGRIRKMEKPAPPPMNGNGQPPVDGDGEPAVE